MNKIEFSQELRKRLEGLSPEDIDATVDYYSEMIDDRCEDGMTEEEAVSALGSIDSIVERILSEYPMKKLVQVKIKGRRPLTALEIVLLVILSPVWVPLLVTLVIVLFSLYMSLWAINCSFYSVGVGCFIGGLAALCAGFMQLATGGAALIGSGLALIGFGGLVFIGSVFVSKGLVWFTKLIWLGIKSIFVGGKDK